MRADLLKTGRFCINFLPNFLRVGNALAGTANFRARREVGNLF